MSKRDDLESLNDIREAARRIERYMDGVSYGELMVDIKTQDAVIRNLEIIGEATKNLSESSRLNFPEIPWKSLAGMRDRLIHHYFGINLDIMWQVAVVDLPRLAEILEGKRG